MASVCNGDQLELTCNVTGRLLEWRFNITRIYIRGISSDTQTPQQLIVNNSRFTFSRTSNQNDVQLVSRLLISPVTDSLNGTNVICEDPVSLLQSTTTILIIQQSLEDLHIGRFYKKVD